MIKTGKIDNSGSCAIIVLILGKFFYCIVINIIKDDYCYVANIGDSRAILSKNNGKEIIALSRDHKPSNKYEQIRIKNSGAKLY